MTVVRKVARVIGWLVIGLVGSVGILVGLVVWGEINVPLSLPALGSRAPVYTNAWDDGYVTAEGTFTFEDAAATFQTSKIKCLLRTLECREARAQIWHVIRMALLNVDEDIYTIQKWDRDTIIFSNDSATCFREVYTIDRTSKSLTGARLRKNAEGECAIAAGSKDRLEITLTDGDKIEKQVRQSVAQEAMPFAYAGLALVWVLVSPSRRYPAH